MDITAISPETLKELIKLAEQKQALLEQIAVIDSSIAKISSGSALPAAAPKKAAKTVKKASVAKRGKRGGLKEGIVSLLSEAGASGIAVLEIAKKLSVKPQGIHAWFQTTGKKVPGIAKVGRGVYSLASAA